MNPLAKVDAVVQYRVVRIRPALNGAKLYHFWATTWLTFPLFQSTTLLFPTLCLIIVHSTFSSLSEWCKCIPKKNFPCHWRSLQKGFLRFVAPNHGGDGWRIRCPLHPLMSRSKEIICCHVCLFLCKRCPLPFDNIYSKFPFLLGILFFVLLFSLYGHSSIFYA